MVENMPSAFLSHQAVVIPFKMRWPQKFDGIALCIGSMMPDLDSIVQTISRQLGGNGVFNWGHSLIGMLPWTIPWTILFTFLFSRWFGPGVAWVVNKVPKLSKPFAYFGVGDWGILRQKRYGFRLLGIAFYSASLGILTHFLLDFPSHAASLIFYPWYVWVAPAPWQYEIANFGSIKLGSLAFNLNLTIYNLVWWLESFILIIPCIVFLRRIKTRDSLRQWYSSPASNL